ncbi:MAG TPA: trypsin-like peptidase domain-containing protein [Candidatus Blautia excrementipullorum]|nr:trypsin-like peptidase domain-containing protein [Candidatus Blautia excrementipullorum]
MNDEKFWDQNAPHSQNEERTGGGHGEISRYAHYQMHQSAYDPERKPLQKNIRKKNKFWKKLPETAALAVVFGLVAGAVFQGVNMVSDQYLEPETQTTLPTTDTAAEEVTETTQSNVSQASGTVASVAQAAMPSVVAITSVSIQEIPSFFGVYGFGGTQQYSSEGSGSGIIVGEDDDELLIATNNHVVEGADTLSVCFIGEDVSNAEAETAALAGSADDINIEDAVSATVRGTDSANDLAVVSVMKADIPDDTLNQIKIAQMGNSDELQVGEQVVAIGNALGYGQSVTSGWVSALDRSIETEDGVSSGLIQTDAAINPGNSGGALLNMNGELIGINSAKYADSAVEGMGYAIPISTAQPILENLMSREKVDASQAGYLGVDILDLSSQAIQMYNVPSGALVYYVEAGTAASNAGIQERDIIVEFDGQTVSGKSDLAEKLQYYAAGETVNVVVARAENGQYVEKSLEVTLGSGE